MNTIDHFNINVYIMLIDTNNLKKTKFILSYNLELLHRDYFRTINISNSINPPDLNKLYT